MVAFSPAQFDAVVNDLNTGCNKLAGKIEELPRAANATLSKAWVPGFVKESIKWLVENACSVGASVLHKIGDLLKGIAAPIRMFFDAWNWMDVRGLCTGVAGTLKDTNLNIDEVWQGTAKDNYVKHMKTHSEAAARCGTIADKVATSLTICAGAGLAFYVALGVIIYQLIVAFIGAIAAVGTGVFSVVGAYVVITDAGISTGMIIAAVSALVALLGAEATQMVAMHGEATDGNFFPSGKWPIPGTQNFSDGSMLDGNETKWYLEKG